VCCTDVAVKQSVTVDAQILMPWRHWTPKIESLGVRPGRQTNVG